MDIFAEKKNLLLCNVKCDDFLHCSLCGEMTPECSEK